MTYPKSYSISCLSSTIICNLWEYICSEKQILAEHMSLPYTKFSPLEGHLLNLPNSLFQLEFLFTFTVKEMVTSRGTHWHFRLNKKYLIPSSTENRGECRIRGFGVLKLGGSVGEPEGGTRWKIWILECNLCLFLTFASSQIYKANKLQILWPLISVFLCYVICLSV